MLILGHFGIFRQRVVESPPERVHDGVLEFSGDAVFHGGTIGLGNWAGSNLEDYRRYIGRLSGLSVEGLYPGHFLWTLRDGQEHLDTAVANMASAWVPPAWQHQHPHR